MIENQYEREIFDFLTKSENFENCLSLASHLDMVKTLLLKELKAAIFEEIEKMLDKNLYNIRLSSIGNIEIFKKSWYNQKNEPSIVYTYFFSNHPYLGIKHCGSEGSISFDEAIKYREKFLVLTEGYSVNSDEGIYIIWKRNTPDLKIGSDGSYISILPCNRDGIVIQFVDDLFRLLSSTNLLIDEIIKNRKINE